MSRTTPHFSTARRATAIRLTSAPRSGFIIAVFALVLGACGSEPPPAVRLVPEISVPSDLDFGRVNVPHAVEQSFAIANVGGAALTIEKVYLLNPSDDETPAFQILTAPPEGTQIPKGEQQEVVVQYQATAAEAVANAVIIETNDENVPIAQVNLLGTGVLAQIDVSPEEINFGSVDVGETATARLTLSNAGEGQLAIWGVYYAELDGDEFPAPALPAGFALGDTIEPGFPIEISLTYTPTDDTTDEGSLIIISDDPVTPQIEIPVKGNGVPDFQPTVTIVYPLDGQSSYVGSDLVFSATITDDQDALDDLVITWSSSIEGGLCSTGMSVSPDFDTVTCTDALTVPGEHTIRLIVTDSGNNTTVDSVDIVVWDEETELNYVISGSPYYSEYAFTADDNIQVFAVSEEDYDPDTGDYSGDYIALCVNDLDDGNLDVETPKTCNATYGDYLHILVYDRYASAFVAPELYLWYGSDETWTQPLIPAPISLTDEAYDEAREAAGCEEGLTRTEWADTNPPEGTYPEDCLLYEAWVQITIPEPEGDGDQ